LWGPLGFAGPPWPRQAARKRTRRRAPQPHSLQPRCSPHATSRQRSLGHRACRDRWACNTGPGDRRANSRYGSAMVNEASKARTGALAGQPYRQSITGCLEAASAGTASRAGSPVSWTGSHRPSLASGRLPHRRLPHLTVPEEAPTSPRPRRPMPGSPRARTPSCSSAPAGRASAARRWAQLAGWNIPARPTRRRSADRGRASTTISTATRWPRRWARSTIWRRCGSS
jgi:hypothetical protein